MESIILTYIDSVEHATFFFKLAKAANKRIIFLTNSFSTYLLLSKRGNEVYLPCTVAG